MATRTLKPVPATPNCVSTQAPEDDTEHRAEPVPFEGDADEAMAAIRAVVADVPRMQVEVDEPGYLHAVATTRIMRFKDDVEFLVDEGARLIHYRSASRVGSSDLGANRSRMERMTAALRARV